MAKINNDAKGEIITMNDTIKRNWWDDFTDAVKVCEQKEVQNIVNEINEFQRKPATMNDIERLENSIAFVKKMMSSMTEESILILKAKLNSYGKQFASKLDQRDPREIVISKLNHKLNVYKNRLKKDAGNEFGELISYTRNSKGWTLTKLAKKAGICLSYLKLIESGKRRSPGADKIAGIAHALDLDMAIIVNTIQKRNGLRADVTPKYPSLYDVLISNDFTVDEKVVDLSIKIKLESMINKIIKSNWLNDEH